DYRPNLKSARRGEEFRSLPYNCRISCGVEVIISPILDRTRTLAVLESPSRDVHRFVSPVPYLYIFFIRLSRRSGVAGREPYFARIRRSSDAILIRDYPASIS